MNNQSNVECNYKKENQHKMWKDFIVTFLGVTLALFLNMLYDSHKNTVTYDNTIKAIHAEAIGNDSILQQTFVDSFIEIRPVFRDLNTKIVENSLSNNTFIEKASDATISDLFNYLVRLKQLNAHRSGLEKLYLEMPTDSINTKRVDFYRQRMIARLIGEIHRFKEEIAHVQQIK